MLILIIVYCEDICTQSFSILPIKMDLLIFHYTAYHSDALKLYIGLIIISISTVSVIFSMISSIGLYAIGDSSIVELPTDVV